MDYLFDSDIVNPLLKTEEGRDRRPSYVNVVVWSALRLVSVGLNSLQQGLLSFG